MKKIWDPKSLVYILCHAVIFAIGIILCTTGKVVLIAIGTSLIAAGYAHQRDLEEGDHAGTITQQVKKFVADTKAITELVAPNSFEIRLFRCLPSVNIFRVDNEMFWGPYLIKQPSRNSPTFLVRRGVLFDRLLQHFDRIWTDDSLSRPVPADW